MNKLSCIALSLALGLTVSTAQAFSLGDAARITSAVAAPGSTAAQSAELVNKLTALNVTPGAGGWRHRRTAGTGSQPAAGRRLQPAAAISTGAQGAGRQRYCQPGICAGRAAGQIQPAGQTTGPGRRHPEPDRCCRTILQPGYGRGHDQPVHPGAAAIHRQSGRGPAAAGYPDQSVEWAAGQLSQRAGDGSIAVACPSTERITA